jgi:mannan endo-1,4-beta-mannosidase
LNLLYRITGSQVVAGQHNDEKRNGDWAYYINLVRQTTGKYPGLWSGDFAFTQSDHSPVVQEALRQWNAGAIVNFMWHGCPPRPGSSVTCGWDGGVISKLSDDEWRSLITDGSAWNIEWKKRMDFIGESLKTMQSQGVEVLFRPLHEMNQGAFWWGGRAGPSGTRRLYQITRDYMTTFLGLTNLVWVWNVQDLSSNFGEFNPGANYFDVESLDVYGEGFDDDTYYQALLKEAGEKPIGIGECFHVPLWFLKSHRRLSFFMMWADKGDHTSVELKDTYDSSIVLNRENLNRG